MTEFHHWTGQQPRLRSDRDARATDHEPISSILNIEHGEYMALPRIRLSNALGRS